MRHFSFLPILWLRFGQGQSGSPSFFHFFFSPSSLSIHLAESPPSFVSRAAAARHYRKALYGDTGGRGAKEGTMV